MDRGNHYEAAFEAYLQWHRLGYVAVDESRRAMLGETRVKSLDFLVFGPQGAQLVADVKGRRFPGGRPERPRRVWECWATQDDVDGLQQWAELSGPGFRGVLVFAYHLTPPFALPEDTDDLWTWRGRRYLLRAVDVGDYRAYMRVRSPRWGTVGVPNPVFRRIARPFHYFTHETRPAAESCPF
jgi:hypothetical protein